MGAVVDACVQSFYDKLAPYYHLIFKDWDESIERQGSFLNNLVEVELGSGSMKILDCACGIGTQSIGFARGGHRVTGSDLSAAAVERARREMEARGLRGTFLASDMTTLAEIEEGDFDVVAALDNALPHLSPGQVRSAAHAMHAKLRPNGLVVAAIRDYDALIRERPTVQGPGFYGTEGQRRIVLQVWDWISEDTYHVHLYITVQRDGRFDSYHFVSTYRCLLRDELSAALGAEGFENIRWILPAESGHYIPVVLARKRS